MKWEDLKKYWESLINKFKTLKITESELNIFIEPSETEKEFEISEKYSDKVANWKFQVKNKIR